MRAALQAAPFLPLEYINKERVNIDRSTVMGDLREKSVIFQISSMRCYH